MCRLQAPFSYASFLKTINYCDRDTNLIRIARIGCGFVGFAVNVPMKVSSVAENRVLGSIQTFFIRKIAIPTLEKLCFTLNNYHWW